MLERDITISNKLGLHARASAKLVQLLQAFKCNAFLVYRGREINAKSIMGVMMLAAEHGSSITFRADGDDADQALDALATLVGNKFGES